MNNYQYPMIEVSLQKLYNNTKIITTLCSNYDIEVAGVVKGFNGIMEVVEQMIKGDCKQIASSRVHHLKSIKEKFTSIPTLLLRIPMMCEIEDVIKYCDISLNSEKQTLVKLNEESKKQNKIHSVILMLDLGDLREGVFTSEELCDLAVFTENQLTNLHLLGVGTNLSCYGTVLPTTENLNRLCKAADHIEKQLGRKLEVISGGATTTLPVLLEGNVPDKINHLRIGDGIISALDLIKDWKVTIDGLYEDTFILKAQIIEINTKPTYPIGELFLNSFGEIGRFEDRGLRKRAILGIGNQDLGDCFKLIPKDMDIIIMGASSDHTIIDINDSKVNYNLGDVVEFNMLYQPMLFLTESPYVNKEFIR